MNINKIPAIRKCFKIMEGQMLPNIIEHSKQVMKVASVITDNLDKDISVNKPLIIAAALLHDITKTDSLKTHEAHDITGGLYMRKLGFQDVAEIIEEHVTLKQFNFDSKLLEKEIVYYADKRVMHDKIVTIDERISDLIIRYGKTDEIIERILQSKNIILNVEKKINLRMKNKLNIVIEDLVTKQKTSNCA